MNKNYKQSNTRSSLRIFGGSSHPTLTKSIARKVGVTVGDLTLAKFANNETSIDLKENVRGQDIYFIQTGGGDKPNDDLMELFFAINAFKLSSANRVNVMIPFFFYSKGDQKNSRKRVPITAKLITNLLKKAGADHVMIIEPHTPQLEGFFDTPVDALKVEPLFCEWIKRNIKDWQNCVVVSPDEGSTKRCTSVANDLNLDFALINNRSKKDRKKGCQQKSCLQKACYKTHHKRRPRAMSNVSSTNTAKSSSEREMDESDRDTKELDESLLRVHDVEKQMNTLGVATNNHHPRKKITVSGSVSGRKVILVDDMIDTGHTLKEALDTLRKFGATAVYILATHAIFSANSVEIVSSFSDFVKKIVVTNTVPQNRTKAILADLLHVIDVSGLIAEYIRRHHYHESVSVLGHFMPIKATETDDFESDDPVDDSEDEEDYEVGDDDDSEEAKATGDAEKGSEVFSEEGVPENAEKARDLRLMHLRKGFRLSSMCWDD